MDVQHITPILNVSSLPETFAWFEKIGWHRGWAWGTREMHIRHPDGHVFRISQDLLPPE